MALLSSIRASCIQNQSKLYGRFSTKCHNEQQPTINILRETYIGVEKNSIRTNL